MKSNLKRKVLHVAMVSVALLVGRIPFIFFPFICLSAIIFNWRVLPLILDGKFLYESEQNRGVSRGLITYPAILLVLSLIFYEKPVFFVAGWAVMAFGDGFSSILGASFKSKKLPWNTEKSWLGFLAFLFFGCLGTFLVLGLLPEGVSTHFNPWIIIIAVSIAGIFETLDGFYDDNISVALVSSVSMFLLTTLLPYEWPTDSALVVAFGISILFSILAYFFTKLSLSGCIAGFLVSFSVVLGFSFSGLLILFIFFSISMFLTKWASKYQRESLKQSQRSYSNVLANGAAASIAALLAAFSPQNETLLFVLFTAAFASAFSDTVSSEIGTAFGKKSFNILNFSKAETGVDGAVSLEGTLAGLLAAVIMGAVYYSLTGTMFSAIVVTLAGFSGNLADSVLGATLQQKGYMTNHSVNFVNTLFAVFFAAILY